MPLKNCKDKQEGLVVQNSIFLERDVDALLERTKMVF